MLAGAFFLLFSVGRLTQDFTGIARKRLEAADAAREAAGAAAASVAPGADSDLRLAPPAASPRLLACLGGTGGCVNLPQISAPPVPRAHRFLHLHRNQPGVLAAVNAVFARRRINILGQALRTDDAMGYLVTDVDRHRDADGNSDSHTDIDDDRHSNSDANVDRNQHSNGDTVVDTYAYSDGNTDRNSNIEPNKDSNGHADNNANTDDYHNSNGDPNSDGDQHRDRHPNSNTNVYRYPYSYSNADNDADTNGDPDSNGDSNCDGDPNTYRYTD